MSRADREGGKTGIRWQIERCGNWELVISEPFHHARLLLFERQGVLVTPGECDGFGRIRRRAPREGGRGSCSET